MGVGLMFRVIILISSLLFLNACSTLGSTQTSHKHTQSVYFAINNLDDGETMSWHDNPSSSHGTVRILVTQNFGGKTCRMINSNIANSYKNRNFTQYACTTNQGRTWQFHSY